MTSRERITMLLKREIPDQMGIYEHYWGETLRDYWPEQGYPKGESPETHFDYDIQGAGGWFNSEPFMGVEEVVEENDRWKVTKNGRGATLKHWKNKSGTPEHVAFEVTTPEIWKKYREPLLEVNRERLGDLEQAKKKIAEIRDRGKFAVMGNLFVFELLRATLGDENFLPALLEEPEWIQDFCQVHLDMFRKHYEIVFSEGAVPDGMFIYEDYGYSNGLFCSPRTLSEIIMPYERELIAFFKEYDLPVILHSCGDIRKAIPAIIDVGFDCLQPMEAKAGCNVVELADEYGDRISFMGNIDVVELTTNDPDLVTAEVETKIKTLRQKRIPYVFHSDHSIPPNVNYETYKHAVKVFRDNCTY